FFQAEDGIRDPLVTGVQTCALPISGTDFRLMYQQTGNLIHQHDPDALIICEGLSYAASLTGVPANPVRLTHPDKVIYSGHDYPWFGHAASQSQPDYLNQMRTNLSQVMDSGSWQ